MASSVTKAVSFRIPIDSYVKMLQEGSEKGLNMTELIYLKIFSQEPSNKGAETKDVEEKIKALENSLKEANHKIAELESTKEVLQRGVVEVSQSFQKQFEEKLIENHELRKAYTRMQETYKKESREFDERENRTKNELTEAYINEIRVLKEENKALNAGEESLVQSIKTYEQIIVKLENKNKQLQGKSEEDAKERKQKEKQISVYEAKIAGFTNDQKALGRVNLKLQQDIQNIKAHAAKEIISKTEKHNNQIKELHEQIKEWMSYNSEDEGLFQDKLWS